MAVHWGRTDAYVTSSLNFQTLVKLPCAELGSVNGMASSDIEPLPEPILCNILMASKLMYAHTASFRLTMNITGAMTFRYVLSFQV